MFSPVLLSLALSFAGASPELTAARQLETFLAAELAEEKVEVVGHQDLQRLLGLAAEQQALGCGEDWACLGDVAHALEVDYLITGRLSRAGRDLTLVLVLLDTSTGRTVERVIVDGPNVSALLGVLGGAARTLRAPMRSGSPRALLYGFKVDRGVLKPPPVVRVDTDNRQDRARELERALGQRLTTRLASRAGVEVMSRDDVARVLEGGGDAEACLEDDDCVADLAGALDARTVLAGRVASLDGVPLVTLTVFEGTGVGARQRLVRKAATLDDVEGTLAGLVDRARLPEGRALLTRIEVDPAVFPLEEPLALDPVPLALLQLAAGTGTATALACIPGLNCVALPLLPGIGALVQLYLGNTLGKRRARLFLPVALSYVVYFSFFGVIPLASLGLTGLQGLLGVGSGGPDPFKNPLGFFLFFVPPLALVLLAGVMSQVAVTVAFALGARHPVTDLNELGLDVVGLAPRRPTRSLRAAMAY